MKVFQIFVDDVSMDFILAMSQKVSRPHKIVDICCRGIPDVIQ